MSFHARPEALYASLRSALIALLHDAAPYMVDKGLAKGAFQWLQK